MAMYEGDKAESGCLRWLAQSQEVREWGTCPQARGPSWRTEKATCLPSEEAATSEPTVASTAESGHLGDSVSIEAVIQ